MKRVIALFLAAAAGCATVEPGRGFDDVSRTAAERAPGRPGVRWDRGGSDDAQARAAVDGLLARELTVETAVQVALLNNRGLRAEYHELDLAQADLVRAGLLRNPVFS
ncbi:MAG TPA: hypothetical protein VEB22_10450, partial [Phycisphaerales bacterium]|nr:hypothetical protein [Phycisphaerales bacterium]